MAPKTAPKSQENLQRGPVINGFDTILEEPSLACKDSSIAPYTLPQEALIFEPAKEDIVCLFKNGDKERKIHNSIELDDVEKASLEELRKEAKAQNCAFLPSITAMATRFLSRARGDPKKAITLMKATQEWRLDYFSAGPVSDEQVLQDLKLGIVYFSGRDFALRPTIIVRPKRIPQEWYKLKCIDRMIKVLIFCMEYMLFYMFVPGRIENTNVIIDLKGLGVTQLPISALSDIYKVMSHHYIGRVFKFYVVNLSWVLNTISGAVKALLTDRQKQKLCILDNVKELRKDFALHHLEEDLGGTRPIIQEFFPFPVQPGPFAAGNNSGPNMSSIKGAHDFLQPSELARQGRLWDARKSREENIALDYSDKAYDLFQRCNYKIPPNCPRPKEEQEEKKEASRKSEEPTSPELRALNPPKRLSKAMRASLKEMGIVSVTLDDDEEDLDADEDTGKDQLSEKQQPGFSTIATNGNTRVELMEDLSVHGEEEELQTETVRTRGWWCSLCAVAEG